MEFVSELSPFNIKCVFDYISSSKHSWPVISSLTMVILLYVWMYPVENLYVKSIIRKEKYNIAQNAKNL
jgi:hypothetical protein